MSSYENSHAGAAARVRFTWRRVVSTGLPAGGAVSVASSSRLFAPGLTFNVASHERPFAFIVAGCPARVTLLALPVVPAKRTGTFGVASRSEERRVGKECA